MKIACGFLLILAFAGLAREAQGQRRMDSWRPISPDSDPSILQWVLMNGSGSQPVLPAPPGGKVSVNTLEIPEAARKEMREFSRNFDAGKLDQSAKHGEKALRISPQWAAAHLDLGQCYARMRQYPKAIEQFQSAATLDTRLVQPWVSLAAAYFLEGQHAEGENAARRALEIDPANSKARYFLGRILAAEEHGLPEAAELLRKSEEQYPAARLTLAHIYLKQSQTDEAIGELRGYLADPNAPQKEKVGCMVEKLTKPTETVNCSMQ
jgi:tetratricopeptide (TPR) repeat protein